MNWLKRLFKKKIEEKNLNDLILALGKSQEYLTSLYDRPAKYSTIAKGYLDVAPKEKGIVFDLDIFPIYFHLYDEGGADSSLGNKQNIKKTIPYEEAIKNPVLKKYIKGKYLEKSLAVFSVASILASTFFLSNNITGNAILTNNANSSGIIGTGLFVFGLVCFFVAKKI